MLRKRAATGEALTGDGSMPPVKRTRLFIEDSSEDDEDNCEHEDKKPKTTSSTL